jgi:transcriptional regulator with XRE-family HTH domain
VWSGQTPTFGEFLARARKLAGYRTQADLAEAMGITQQAVSDWEADKTRPSDTHMTKLVELLDLDPVVVAAASQARPDELLEVLERIANGIEDCARALRERG